jgi:hypothetical protein
MINIDRSMIVFLLKGAMAFNNLAIKLSNFYMKVKKQVNKDLLKDQLSRIVH